MTSSTTAGAGLSAADFEKFREYFYKRTGIFPIMHLVVLRRDVYERHRWAAMNLTKAFEEAKNRSLARAADITLSFFPLPWTPDYAGLSRAVMGEDFWPYGVEANRRTLEAFVQYGFEQGVSKRRLKVEELFAPETLERAKI